jgi:hypothetical protein
MEGYVYRCHYCCYICERFWCEIWEESTPDICDACKTTSHPYRSSYAHPSNALAMFLGYRDPNQLDLFGDDDA